jgi:hypothetical protein
VHWLGVLSGIPQYNECTYVYMFLNFLAFFSCVEVLMMDFLINPKHVAYAVDC